MATFKNGRLSGKVGNMVFYSLGKKVYVRSAPRKSDKVASEPQMRQRSRFALCTRFLKPLSGVIQQCFNPKGKDGTPYSRAMSHALSIALTGDYPNWYIDPAKVLVSKGRMMLPQDVHLEVQGTNSYLLRWSGYPVWSTYDKLVLVAYDEQQALVYMLDDNCTMQDESRLFDLPPDLLGGQVHFYLFATRASWDDFSNSLYLGLFDTVTKPYDTTDTP